MKTINKPRLIDLGSILRRVRAERKTFYKSLSVTLVLSILIALGVAKEYSCEVHLAPETTSGNKSSLSSLASSLGMDMLSSMNSTDAISPNLYPDLMQSPNFLTSLFSVPVKTLDGKVETTYYDYLVNHSKQPWWSECGAWVGSLFGNEPEETQTEVNPFHLTKQQSNIVKGMSKQIQCGVDKRTLSIAFKVIDTDPLVAAMVAEAVRVQLQQVITDYRTNKARTDVEYLKQLHEKAAQEYADAMHKYSAYSDANQDLVRQRYKSRLKELSDDLDLKFTAYSTLCTRLQAAEAKVQENTPAFTIVQAATVPLQPDGPRRSFIVLSSLAVVFLLTCVFIYRKDIIHSILYSGSNHEDTV